MQLNEMADVLKKSLNLFPTLSNKVKKKLLSAFNYKRRNSKRGKKIWVELINSWNSYHRNK